MEGSFPRKYWRAQQSQLLEIREAPSELDCWRALVLLVVRIPKRDINLLYIDRYEACSKIFAWARPAPASYILCAEYIAASTDYSLQITGHYCYYFPRHTAT